VAQLYSLAVIAHPVKWSTKIKVLVGVVGVVVMCALAFVAYTSSRDLSFHPRQFDSTAWKQGDIRVRGEMIESLRSQALLRDKTRDEVLALLGKPDGDDQGQIRYHVDIGMRIAWRPFLSSLYIEFDDKSRVSGVQMVD
jgi:hypothetical protein